MPVAVVGDGSALHGGGPELAAESIAVLLEDDAAGLGARAGIPVWAAPVPAAGAEDLAARLGELPSDTGAIFLTHTDPERARAARRLVHEAGGPPVLTDAIATAVCLTAALLTTVARAGREVAASQVVITGSATLPELCPLVIATGVGDIASWTAADAHTFPLQRLAGHATAVIDLLGATRHPSGWLPGERRSSVLGPGDPAYRLLPVPGLLAALVRCPDRAPGLDVFLACALAMAAVTPPDRLVPDLDGAGLTEAIVTAVCRVVAQRQEQERG